MPINEVKGSWARYFYFQRTNGRGREGKGKRRRVYVAILSETMGSLGRGLVHIDREEAGMCSGRRGSLEGLISSGGRRMG